MTFLLALLIGVVALANPPASTTEPAAVNRLLDGF